MTSIAPGLHLEGMMDFIAKSKSPLASITEALSNALEAIADRQKGTPSPERGMIVIRLNYTGLLENEKELESVEVVDNGIGFNEDNYRRFIAFLDPRKGYKNRGSGRVQYLHFAGRIEVTSCYEEQGVKFQRRFLCSPKAFISASDKELVTEPRDIGTTLVMRDLGLKDAEKTYFDNLTLTSLKSALKNIFLLRLHLERASNPALAPIFRLQFFKNTKLLEQGQLTAEDIPEPATGNIRVPYVKVRQARVDDIEWIPQVNAENLQWAHFKLGAEELDANQVVLCSKSIAVATLRFDSLKKAEAVDGYRFLTAVHGPVLDDPTNVSHTVDRFTFPTKENMEADARDGLLFDPAKEILFADDINHAVEQALPLIYSDLFERRAKQDRDVEAIARAHGIPTEIAKSIRFGLSDTEAQITDKLYKKDAEIRARQSMKIKKAFEALDTLSPTLPGYQAELAKRVNELLELIPEQNKRELSRYIIRRQMVAKVLGLVVDKKIVPASKPSKSGKGKKAPADREGLVHDLLFKRRTGTAAGPNDLWVLNEEFVHFEGSSELPLDKITDGGGNKLLRPIPAEVLAEHKIKPGRRPDVFLYLDEAQCVLIELKEPDVDLSDYLNQLPKYCTLIANFSVKPITRFFWLPAVSSG